MLQICLLRKFIEIRKKRGRKRGWTESFYFKYPIKILSYLKMDYINT